MYECTHVCTSLSCLSECKVKTLVCGSIIIHVYSYLGRGDAMQNNVKAIEMHGNCNLVSSPLERVMGSFIRAPATPWVKIQQQTCPFNVAATTD